jgi:Flp pilus assembly protein TadD
LYIGHAGLGAVAMVEEKYKESYASLAKAATMKPADATLFSNIGEVMLRLGYREEADQILRFAVKLDAEGKDPGANRARAMLLGLHSGEAVAAQGA